MFARRVGGFCGVIVRHVTTPAAPGEPLRLTELTPYVSITVLECTGKDPEGAFNTLQNFLRRSAHDRGRALSVRVAAEAVVPQDELPESGISGLYGIRRVVSKLASWAGSESSIVDVVNQLTIAVRRSRLVGVYTDITSDPQFAKWMDRQAAPFKMVSVDVLARTFPGDGKMVWTRGVHRRRTTKPDSKALGGMRIQDALDPIDDGSFVMRAATVDHQPADDQAIVRSHVTLSADSRVAWGPTADFVEFLEAVAEILDSVDKSLAGGDPAEREFPLLAVAETDLSRVRGAFDISVADPDEIRSEPYPDEDQVSRAGLLRGTFLEVRGDPNSAVATVDVGFNGSVAGTLSIKPLPAKDGFTLDVRYAGTPTAEAQVRQIRDAIQDGDLLTVYYESGHSFTGRGVSRQNLSSQPFPNLRFEDFTGFVVTKEKPTPRAGETLHDAIARGGDDSLFGWVVQRYGQDWLLCHDGAGEIADFLHLDNEGTLTAIHVKAANSMSSGRRVGVTSYEQVVSQAVKNIDLLVNDVLVDRLKNARTAWHDGRAVAPAAFVQQLAARVASDRTRVMIVQPHLLEAVHDQARAATDAGQPNRDSFSLMLLDTLLHTSRRTVTARWDDLVVVGCA
jgi:hypothetical protein